MSRELVAGSIEPESSSNKIKYLWAVLIGLYVALTLRWGMMYLFLSEHMPEWDKVKAAMWTWYGF